MVSSLSFCRATRGIRDPQGPSARGQRPHETTAEIRPIDTVHKSQHGIPNGLKYKGRRSAFRIQIDGGTFRSGAPSIPFGIQFQWVRLFHFHNEYRRTAAGRIRHLNGIGPRRDSRRKVKVEAYRFKFGQTHDGQSVRLQYRLTCSMSIGRPLPRRN